MRGRLIGLSLGAVLVAALVERALGRVWWCKCGSWAPWSWDIWSLHNSQHLVDPYSFTHVQHGLVFYALLRLVVGDRALGWRAFAAVGLESAWEVLENSPLIIDRYRAVTASLDYHGDSVANSVSDIGCCALGFWLASRLPARVSVGLFVAAELGLVLWIRDSLLLNVLMLVWPLEAVRRWQTPGAQ